MDRSTQVVPMPRWSIFVGWARVTLAILVLVLTAAATAIWGGYGDFGFALFTSAATLLIFGYYFVALAHQPALYNRWAVLGLEIFGVIFWLVTFVLLAHWTSVYNGFWYGENNAYGFWNAPFAPADVGIRSRSIVKRGTNKYHAGVALAGTAAGLGGVEFVLYAVTLVVFGMSLHKQRMAAPRSDTTATATATATPSTAPAADIEAAKTEVEETKTEPETATV